MSFGFFARGQENHIVIDDENPVLRHLYSGDLRVTHLQQFQDAYLMSQYKRLGSGWGHCEVVYPQPVKTELPPLVFGTPGGLAGDVSIGLFSHIGVRGNWTGFRMLFLGRLEARIYGFGSGSSSTHGERNVAVGDWTGWTYHVCVAEAAPPVDGRGFGLRIFSTAGDIIFDSNWKIVPFRGLLANWSEIGWPGSPYPTAASNRSFPLLCDGRRTSQDIDVDPVSEYYAHPWGGADGSLGILLSSCGAMSQYVDFGKHIRVYAVPMFGFRGSDRSRIICWVNFGYPQHKSATAGQALNGWGLLTADLSRV